MFAQHVTVRFVLFSASFFWILCHREVTVKCRESNVFQQERHAAVEC